jgi:YebC/PmpR family DNA-binding regulatory protein
MSGHSKWSKIKRAKGASDAKRGAMFTKLGNLIAIAAREKGGDPDTNFALRMAIDKAKAANMPKENIERSIKRGTGELEGGRIEELYYEGFGPINSQFIVKALTDNKNRTAANVRSIFTKFGGSLGSVMWNFEQKGVINITLEAIKEAGLSWDDIELGLIDSGAQDILKEEEGITVFTKIEDLQAVKKFLEDKAIETESADNEYMAKEEIEVPQENKDKIEKFVEALENNEDVSDYYSNISNI